MQTFFLYLGLFLLRHAPDSWSSDYRCQVKLTYLVHIPLPICPDSFLPSPFLTPYILAPGRCEVKHKTPELVPVLKSYDWLSSSNYLEGLGMGENRDDHRSVKKKFVSLSAAPLPFANACWFPLSLLVMKNPADTWWCEEPSVVPAFTQVI